MGYCNFNHTQTYFIIGNENILLDFSLHLPRNKYILKDKWIFYF